MARNIAFSLAGGITSAVFTAVLILFLVRALGPTEYGVFALAVGIGGLVMLPANLGITNAMARFIAESRHHRPTVLAVISDAFRLKLITLFGFCLAVVLVAQPIANAYGEPGLVWPIRILSLAIFGQSMYQLYSQILEAEGKLSVYLRIVSAESAVEAVSSIALVLAGLGAAGAMAGRAGAYMFAAAFGLILIVRTVGAAPRINWRGHGHTRRILGYGSALLIVDGAFSLFDKVDILLIGAILSFAEVGQFEAAMRLAAMTTYAGAAVAAAVGPRISRGGAGPDTAALDRALKRLMAIQGVFIAPFVVWAEPLTRIALGSEYTESSDVVRAIAPFVFLLAISPLVSRAVSYMGEARLRIPIAIGALLVNLLIDLLLLSKIGILAGAIGTDVAYTLYAGAHLWLCRRLVGTRLRPLARTLAAVGVAVAAMSAVLLAFGTTDLSLPVVFLGGALGVAAYVGALLATGELTRSDLADARALLGRAIGSRRRSASPS